MKVLVVSSRFPWPPYTGDRLRAALWLSALESEADVALVAPPGRVPRNAPHFRFYPAKRSLAHAARAALRILGGVPLQSLLAAPYDWHGAIARATHEMGDADASIVLLSRLDPLVRGALPQGFRIFDAIDSLRRNMDERARRSSFFTRWLWRAEANRIARIEADAARAYDRVVAVSEEDAAELGAVAIPIGVAVQPLATAPRAFDFGFWGRLGYFANADAASWLIDEIWPAIRARRPNATLVIGGAAASARIRNAGGRDGITVQSPVPDIAQLARNVKVALLPLRYGTGQSTKVPEAAEGGCAIVATSKALRGFDDLAKHASIAETTNELATNACALLEDESRRDAMAAALRTLVETRHTRRETLARLAAIVQRREAAA